MSNLDDQNGKLYCHINCGNEANNICPVCHLPFCDRHKSELDPSLCSECISINNTVITSKPLIDDEGVAHKGRQLVLTGESWMRSRDVISRMTDVELAAKLEALKEAVHEAELVLDYRKIILGQAENEQSSRLSKKLARLRLITVVGEAHKIGVAAKKPNGEAKIAEAKSNVADALGALKKMGLNKDAIANVLLKLAQTKKENKP